MARYDYRCPACGVEFEVEHPMAEHPTIMCPECGAEASRVFGASGIVFKGSGFYNTDQRGKASSATSATSASGHKAESKASGGGKADAGGKTSGD